MTWRKEREVGKKERSGRKEVEKYGEELNAE